MVDTGNRGLDPRVGLLNALLFLHAEPVDLDQAMAWMEIASRQEFQTLLHQLDDALRPLGLCLDYVEGKVALATLADLHQRLALLVDRARTEPEPLSHGAWETLAVIAYKQPITRLEVEAYRQAGSERTLATLQERNLIEEVGRKETPGRPILYGTTPYFLRQFGLVGLNDLPPLKDETNA